MIYLVCLLVICIDNLGLGYFFKFKIVFKVK